MSLYKAFTSIVPRPLTRVPSINSLGAGGIYICTHAPTAPRGRHIYMPKRLCVLYGLPALTCSTIEQYVVKAQDYRLRGPRFKPASHFVSPSGCTQSYSINRLPSLISEETVSCRSQGTWALNSLHAKCTFMCTRNCRSASCNSKPQKPLPMALYGR